MESDVHAVTGTAHKQTDGDTGKGTRFGADAVVSDFEPNAAGAGDVDACCHLARIGRGRNTPICSPCASAVTEHRVPVGIGHIESATEERGTTRQAGPSDRPWQDLGDVCD